MSITKVKKVQGNGTYESQYGLLYKFDYDLEDGTFISANHKTEKSFQIGDEVEYNIKGEANGMPYGTVSKPKDANFSGGFKSKSQGSTSSFALSYAKDMAVAHISQGKEFKADDVIKVADVFNNWLKQNS